MIADLLDNVGSVVEGSSRYLAATRAGWDIGQCYLPYQRSKWRAAPGQAELLAQAHQRGAAILAQLFHDNGAIWIKFGQFLSSRSDILPPAYISALQRLQSDARALPFAEVEPVLCDAWGADWRRRFARFDETPVAAASVAQVHRAVLADGVAVAVKIQLPHAARLFAQDARVFEALSRALAPLISHFDLRQVVAQIVDMTEKELDFLLEEANLRRFEALPHGPLIHVPHLYGELSNRRVLVTEWIDGTRLTDHLDQHPEQAEPLLRQMLHNYIQQITTFGVYHADPHPGNFLVMGDGRIAVLDYGAIGVLTAEETRHYAILFQVMFGRIQLDIPMGELFRQAGFVARDQRVFEEVAELILKEALRKSAPTDILAIALDRMRDLKIQIPDSFVSLARVVLTFGGLLNMYKLRTRH